MQGHGLTIAEPCLSYCGGEGPPQLNRCSDKGISSPANKACHVIYPKPLNPYTLYTLSPAALTSTQNLITNLEP